MTWTAVLDILIAAFVIYQALVFIQGRRAMHMVVGVGLVVAFVLPRPLDAAGYRLLASFDSASVFCVPDHHCISVRNTPRSGSLRTKRVPGSLSRINRSESTEEIILCVEKLASKQTGALILLSGTSG
jgi:DNA integrity scanning protein DisA with diadenylate cyclase activity